MRRSLPNSFPGSAWEQEVGCSASLTSRGSPHPQRQQAGNEAISKRLLYTGFHVKLTPMAGQPNASRLQRETLLQRWLPHTQDWIIYLLEIPKWLLSHERY
ncbi:MAG: hypothetical protein KME57_12540 [Scytonema hyalinum WJT4-NPBG1]|jgi:hypothetical protein|nr:hypothetical protein [Scytonema hyalinum WJT4-NPBG1]